MASENEPISSYRNVLGQKLRTFCEFKGSVRTVAEALQITPQQLQKYVRGAQKPGSDILAGLQRQGCNIDWLLDDQKPLSSFSKFQAPALEEFSSHLEANECPPTMGSDHESLDWIGIEGVIGRKLEDIAYKFDATPQEVAVWRSGGAPRLNQMGKILDLVVTAAIGARAYAKMLSEIEAPTAHPDAVPAAGTSNQASKAA